MPRGCSLAQKNDVVNKVYVLGLYKMGGQNRISGDKKEATAGFYVPFKTSKVGKFCRSPGFNLYCYKCVRYVYLHCTRAYMVYRSILLLISEHFTLDERQN